MELWFVLAILVPLLWGCGGIFAKLSTPKLGMAKIAVLIVVVNGTMYFLGFYYWHNKVAIALGDGVLVAISCMFSTIAYLCFFESIVNGKIAIAGTITAAYPVLTVVGALVFLSETVTPTQTMGLTAMTGGVVVLSYEPNPRSEHATPRSSVFFALLAFVFWGMWGLTTKMAINAVGPENILGFYAISSCAVPLVYLSFRGRQLRRRNPSRSAWVFGVTGLATNVIGTFCLSFALEEGYASLVIPISSAYPLITVILAVAVLHEKLNRLHTIALAFVIAGLVVIGIAE
jgi:transporter family protein